MTLRRAVLAIALAAGLAGCEKKVVSVRVGYCPEIGHAPAMIGFARGDFTRAVNLPIRPMLFANPPSTVEALVKGELDLAFVSMAPAVAAFVRNKHAVVVVAGAASGGAALVVPGSGDVKTIEDLREAEIATPAIGDNEDVAARVFFGEQGFVARGHGGNFHISPVASQDQPDILARQDAKAGWTVEPWVSVVVAGGGKILLEEDDLWKKWAGVKSGPVAIVIARKDFLKDHSDIVRRFLGAERDELDWMRDHPAEARQVVSETITRLTGRQFETGVIDNAFSRVRFDMEISTAAIVTSGYQCDRLGFLGPADLETKGLIDDAPLRKVLNGHKPEEKK